MGLRGIVEVIISPRQEWQKTSDLSANFLKLESYLAIRDRGKKKRSGIICKWQCWTLRNRSTLLTLLFLSGDLYSNNEAWWLQGQGVPFGST